MRIGKLISELIKLKIKYGDVEVFAEDPDYGDGGAYAVTEARYYGRDKIVIWHGTGSYCKQCGRGCD